MRMNTLGLAGAAVAALMAGRASAQSGTVYSNTFETGHTLGTEWSAGSTVNWAYWGAFTNFNGNYSNGSTTLTLAQPTGPGLPGGSSGEPGGGGGGPGPGGMWIQYRVKFDLFIIDSWDGDLTINGPDRFRVAANGVTLMNETFGNQPGSTQSFRAPDRGPQLLGFRETWMDSIYRNIELPFTVPVGSPISITWADGGLQGIMDESWGIDNVSVTYEVVPAPAGAGLLCAAGLVAMRRRR